MAYLIKDRMVVPIMGVANYKEEKTRDVNKLVNNGKFEIKLKYPEHQLTKQLGYNEIWTILYYDKINIEMIQDFVESRIWPSPTNANRMNEKNHLIHLFLNAYDVTMNMDVKFSNYGNVESDNVMITSIRERQQN